jgi:hypothetical protein
MIWKHARWLPLAVPMVLALGTTAARAELRTQGDLVTLSDAPGTELPITVRIRVAAEAGAQAPTALLQARYLPVTAWRSDGNSGSALIAEAAGGAALGGLTVTLRLSNSAEGAYTLRAEAQSTAPVWIGQLAVELEMPDGAASLGGRELRLRPLGRAAAMSGLDPKWLIVYSPTGGKASKKASTSRRSRARGKAREAGLSSSMAASLAAAPETPVETRVGRPPSWTLLVDDDADGLTASRQGAHIVARVDVLSTEARPFTHFVSCTDNWRAPNHREPLSARLVQPDEPLRSEMMLYTGAAVPLFKARYPEGRSSAIVITDHADQTAALTLRALIGGTSDMTSPRWGQSGLLGHGLGITKSLWMSSGEPAPPPLLNAAAHGGPHGRAGHNAHNVSSFRNRYGRPPVDSTGGGRPQLDDPEVAEMAERMARFGWEIVPHSATPLRDERDRTEMALEVFARYKARTWIDHQPYTNCEALVNQGYQTGPFGIVDLLHKFGYSYAWSGMDVAPGSLNLLSPRRIDRYVPVLWPAGRLFGGTPSGLWLFSTMMTYVDGPKFFKLYSKRALDQLERERGLHIAHSYLEAFHPPTSQFGKRNLMIPGKKPGEVVLDPKLEALFGTLSSRVAAGSLWVPTLSQLGDHIRAMSGVGVRLLADGSAVLRSAHALTGATFVVPRPGLRVLIDGQPPKGQRTNRKETLFWVDLPADRDVHVMLLDAHGEMVVFRRLLDGKSLIARRTS